MKIKRVRKQRTVEVDSTKYKIVVTSSTSMGNHMGFHICINDHPMTHFVRRLTAEEALDYAVENLLPAYDPDCITIGLPH